MGICKGLEGKLWGWMSRWSLNLCPNKMYFSQSLNWGKMENTAGKHWEDMNLQKSWFYFFFLPSWNYLLALLKKPQNRQNEGKQAQRRKISTAALSRFPCSAKSCRFWVPNPPQKKVPGKFTCPSFNSAHHLEFPACSLTSNSHLALPKAAFMKLFHLHSWKFFDPQHLLAWFWSIQAPSVGINPWDKAAKIIFLNWLFLARAPPLHSKEEPLGFGFVLF